MKKALIIIDYINDFVEDNGKLTCGKPAQDIDGIIEKLVRTFKANGDFIVVASDSHEKDDKFSPEHALFPEHCVSGTPGCELFGKTNAEVESIPKDKLIYIKKNRYSAFAGTSLDMKLRERDIKNVCLVGVCSDICVLHTAIDAYNIGYKITIYKDAIASFNEKGHNFTLEHLKNVLGAEIL